MKCMRCRRLYRSARRARRCPKRKHYHSMMKFTEREVCAPGFLDRYVEACETAAPLVEFLTKALGLRW
jgi:hypothetical protein